jgi:protein-disulfide isomerase
MAPYRRLSLVLFALVAAVGLRAASAAPKPAPQPVLAEEMSLGNAKAKVTVVEYASASCPHCAAFNNETFDAFRKKYVDTGKVRYVFREFLTPPEQFAGAAFLIARCAGKDKYFPFLSDVFHEQAAIYESNDLAGGLIKIAAKYGLSKDDMTACTSDEKAVQALNDRVTKAEKDGVDATPTFVIGDTKIEGERPLAELSAVIDPLLAK